MIQIILKKNYATNFSSVSEEKSSNGITQCFITVRALGCVFCTHTHIISSGVGTFNKNS